MSTFLFPSSELHDMSTKPNLCLFFHSCLCPLDEASKMNREQSSILSYSKKTEQHKNIMAFGQLPCQGQFQKGKKQKPCRFEEYPEADPGILRRLGVLCR